MPSSGMWAARVLGIVWTLPNTLLGLVAGAVGMLAGARPRFNRRDFALVFHYWPWGRVAPLPWATPSCIPVTRWIANA